MLCVRGRGRGRGTMWIINQTQRFKLKEMDSNRKQAGNRQVTYKEKYKVTKNEYENEKEGVFRRESHTLAVLCRLDARRRRKIGYPT